MTKGQTHKGQIVVSAWNLLMCTSNWTFLGNDLVGFLAPCYFWLYRAVMHRSKYPLLGETPGGSPLPWQYFVQDLLPAHCAKSATFVGQCTTIFDLCWFWLCFCAVFPVRCWLCCWWATLECTYGHWFRSRMRKMIVPVSNIHFFVPFPPPLSSLLLSLFVIHVSLIKVTCFFVFIRDPSLSFLVRYPEPQWLVFSVCMLILVQLFVITVVVIIKWVLAIALATLRLG